MGGWVGGCGGGGGRVAGRASKKRQQRWQQRKLRRRRRRHREPATAPAPAPPPPPPPPPGSLSTHFPLTECGVPVVVGGADALLELAQAAGEVAGAGEVDQKVAARAPRGACYVVVLLVSALHLQGASKGGGMGEQGAGGTGARLRSSTAQALCRGRPGQRALFGAGAPPHARLPACGWWSCRCRAGRRTGRLSLQRIGPVGQWMWGGESADTSRLCNRRGHSRAGCVPRPWLLLAHCHSYSPHPAPTSASACRPPPHSPSADASTHQTA